MSTKLWIGKKMYLVDEEIEEYIESLKGYKQAWEKIENFLLDEKTDYLFIPFTSARNIGKSLLNSMRKILKQERGSK